MSISAAALRYYDASYPPSVWGGGGGGAPPAPVLVSLTPNSVPVGVDTPITIVCTGCLQSNNFEEQAELQVDGVAQPYMNNPSTGTFTYAATSGLTAGTHQVTMIQYGTKLGGMVIDTAVQSPPSNALTLTVV